MGKRKVKEVESKKDGGILKKNKKSTTFEPVLGAGTDLLEAKLLAAHQIPGANRAVLTTQSTDSKPLNIKDSFRAGLFDEKVLKQYTNDFKTSEPYKHAVIHELMNDDLLRSVRNEVREHISFTPKETDIYKIHQSGDLANLDGLDDKALESLPSLLKLRDSLYSKEFRDYASKITNSGALSGKKTDMAINVYTPGCHLLCHDDVIGSRRISYILYLPDPDIPWKPEWGGALRLYPTTPMPSANGEIATVPSADFSKVIPPAWNQLSFFTVQPGLSFHDVEEVYHAENKEQLENEGGRVRMAISGWFHIPQEGEEGYIPGEEERLAEKSSLTQLQGKDEHDFPKEAPVAVSEEEQKEEEGFEEEDIEFLLKFMTPHYLTPDTMDQVAEHYKENFSVTVDNLLSRKFSEKLRKFVEAEEAKTLPETAKEIEKMSDWMVATPPYKHKYLCLQPNEEVTKKKEMTPIEELVNVLLPSKPFRKWLKVATKETIENYDILARRFRKGSDYALATAHEGAPRLEVCLGFTPTTGWGDDEEPEEQEEEEQPEPKGKKAKLAAKKEALAKAKAKAKREEMEAEKRAAEALENDVGGHEVYMAADDDDDDDAAVYKASAGDDDDPTLFTCPASWNKMSIVLRDSGVLKFTKYISRNAKGDRWDVSASFAVGESDSDDESGSGSDERSEDGSDEDMEDESGDESDDSLAVDDGETFAGFSD